MIRQADCLLCGDLPGQVICKECEIQIGDDNFVMKCMNCSSYGFIKRNQTNYNRLRTFLGNTGMGELDNYWIVVIPTKYCLECMEEYKDGHDS